MLKINILTSGSRDGNCAVIDNGKTKMMIDIGHIHGGWKRVENDLSQIGINYVDINALLITHRHGDHVKQLNNFLKKHPEGNSIVYTTELVAQDIDLSHKFDAFDPRECVYMKKDNANIVGTFEVIPRVLKHDGFGPSRVSECIGFEIYDTVNKKWILFATDTSTLKPFAGQGNKWDAVCVESNYNEEMLEANYMDCQDNKANFATYVRTKDDHLSVEKLTDFIMDEGITCPIIELHESNDNKIKHFDKEKYSLTLMGEENNLKLFNNPQTKDLQKGHFDNIDKLLDLFDKHKIYGDLRVHVKYGNTVAFFANTLFGETLIDDGFVLSFNVNTEFVAESRIIKYRIGTFNFIGEKECKELEEKHKESLEEISKWILEKQKKGEL